MFHFNPLKETCLFEWNLVNPGKVLGVPPHPAELCLGVALTPPVCLDPGGGGEAQRNLAGAGPPVHAQRHGVAVSGSRTHSHRQKLPTRLRERWERGN